MGAALLADHANGSISFIIFWGLLLAVPALIAVPAVLLVVAAVLRRRWHLRRTVLMILPAFAVTLVVPPVVVALGPDPEWGEGATQLVVPNIAAITLSLFAYALAVSIANRDGGVTRASVPPASPDPV